MRTFLIHQQKPIVVPLGMEDAAKQDAREVFPLHQQEANEEQQPIGEQ